MIRYGINNIRELVGHKVDIDGALLLNGVCAACLADLLLPPGVERAAAVRFP